MAMKKIFNYHEEVTHNKLRDICKQHGVSVYPKLRIADILPIEKSGISDTDYRFALQSHFDFVVVDSKHTPLFAVEFDGPTHNREEQKSRDETKYRLCDRFEFPILRINARHLFDKYRNFDLLSWFVEVWFLREAFFEAQEAGGVPWDESFDPMLFLSLPSRKEKFPLWLSAELRVKIQRLSESGRCLDFGPSEWIGVDSQGNYHGISWLMIDDKSGVFANSAMRSQRFPIIESEILSEILVFEIYKELNAVLEGQSKPLSLTQLDEIIKDYSEKYKMRTCTGISRSNNG